MSVRFAQPTSEAQKLDAARKLRTDTSDLVGRRLQEALDNAADRGAPHMKFDREFVEAIATMVEQRKEEYLDMKKKLDGLKVRRRMGDYLVFFVRRLTCWVYSVRASNTWTALTLLSRSTIAKFGLGGTLKRRSHDCAFYSLDRR